MFFHDLQSVPVLSEGDKQNKIQNKKYKIGEEMGDVFSR